MTATLSQFVSYFSDSQVLVLSLIFVASVLVVFAVGNLFRPDEVAERLSRVNSLRSGDSVRLRQEHVNFKYRQLFERLQSTFEPGSAEKRSALRQKLLRAGFLRSSAIVHYYLWRVGLAVVLPVVAPIAVFFLAGGLAPNVLLLLAVVTCAIGYFLPYFFVRNKIIERQRKAREGFPDALDMLLVCVEAGLGLSAAIERVGREIGKSHPVLAEQFGLVGLEMRAGTSRADALKNFARRLGVDEVNAFVTLLVQSEALGTSIADSLRVYAHEMRTARLMRAEEMANKLPVKIAIPLGFGILPCLIIVIMTPVAIRIVRAIFPVVGG